MPLEIWSTLLREMQGSGREIAVVDFGGRDVSGEERRRLDGVDRVLRKGDASLQDLAAEVERLGYAWARQDAAQASP